MRRERLHRDEDGAHTVTATNGRKSPRDGVVDRDGRRARPSGADAGHGTIASGGSQAYTAQGRDQYDNSLGDVTSTHDVLDLAERIVHGRDLCTPSAAGTHTVTGTKSGTDGDVPR